MFHAHTQYIIFIKKVMTQEKSSKNKPKKQKKLQNVDTVR